MGKEEEDEIRMCGIIGYIGRRNAVPILISSLKRLEYRGYDSAGIAVFMNGEIEVRRCAGKIKDLESSIRGQRLKGNLGLGHTRWATHGRPTEENAHPHMVGGIVVVHNGIIENYLELKDSLMRTGHNFISETDTEVICHLIKGYSDDGFNLESATKKALTHLRGTYALAIISRSEPDKIIAVKRDSPLVVGLGNGEYFVASDIPAFITHTRDVIIPENDELVVITKSGARFSDRDNKPLRKKPLKITWSPAMAEKGGYKHFMLKEIFEQPRSIADTIRGRLLHEEGCVNLKEFSLTVDELRRFSKVFLIACGTSWHAALVGKYMIEDMARLPCEVDIASEFRYRNPIIPKNSLVIVITQSGETADTIAAQREAKRQRVKVLSICNVVGSTSAREADAVFYTHSGPEIGVASTKSFTSQLVALYLFSIAIATARDMMNTERARSLFNDLLALPEKIETALRLNDHIKRIAKRFYKARDFLYLGRGINYPIALEGALKLKEISYIHAEGYPAGEMKHGPIALIDDGVPVLVIVPEDNLYEKVLSNIEEVRSRGGRVIAVTTEGDKRLVHVASCTIPLPKTNGYLMPVVFSIPMHLLAYHIAVLRGCNVDQPRNLAKSVTVE